MRSSAFGGMEIPIYRITIESHYVPEETKYSEWFK